MVFFDGDTFNRDAHPMEKPKVQEDDLESAADFVFRLLKKYWPVATSVAVSIAAGLATFHIPDLFARVAAWIITLALIGVAIIAARRIRRAQQKHAELTKRIKDNLEQGKARTSFRDLVSFEEKDFLPGSQRRRDANTIFTQLSSDAVALRVVSGEVGAGKTSVLKAGLAKLMRDDGFSVAVLSSPLAVVQAKESGRVKIDTALGRLGSWVDTSFQNPDDKRVLLIDQFEELLVRYRGRGERARLARFMRQLATRKPAIRLLCAIRKDSYTDFLDISAEFEDFVSNRDTTIIRNFSAEEAVDVIQECAAHDEIKIPQGMPEAIARDLAESDEVRPAELQIVCTALRGDFRLENYQAHGGAQAILAGHVRRVIDGSPKPDLTRLVLRSLCDFGANAKSKPLELRQIAEFAITGERKLSLQDLERALEQCESQRLVVQVSADASVKWALIHDYLVEAIKAATQDESTRVEEARQQLKGFIAEYRTDKRTRIPLQKLNNIQKLVPKELLLTHDAKHLIRRSYITGYGRPALIALVSVLIVSLSTGYIGTVAVWRAVGSPRQDNRWTGEVSVQGVKVQDRQLVLTADNSGATIWNGENGERVSTFRGRVSAASYPYLIMRDADFRGSEFFLQFSSVNLQTHQVQDIKLPFALIEASLLGGDREWSNGNKFFVLSFDLGQKLSLLFGDMNDTVLRDTGVSANRDTGAYAIDDNRILVTGSFKEAPKVWNIAQSKFEGQLQLPEDNNFTLLSVATDPERKRAITLTSNSVDDIGSRHALPPLALRIWDLKEATPKPIEQFSIEADAILRQFFDTDDHSPESGLRFDGDVTTTQSNILVDLSLENSTGSASFLFNPSLQLLDHGEENQQRGTIGTQDVQLSFFGKPDGSVNFWDLQSGAMKSVPGLSLGKGHYLKWGPGKETFLIERGGSSVELWDLDKHSRSVSFADPYFKRAFFTLEGSAIALLREGGGMDLFSTLGANLGSLTGITGNHAPAATFHSRQCELIVWTGDGRVLKFANNWSVLGLFDMPRHGCLSG